MTRLSKFSAALALVLPVAAPAAPVSVDLSGLRAGGILYVQLQTREQFLGPQRVAGNVVQAPSAGTLSVDLGDVPPGDYAIGVWHDQNGNSRMEIDPTAGANADGWAMPNGDSIRARPEFDQVKLAVPADGLRVPLRLHYGR